jgi:hypothetical protein
MGETHVHLHTPEELTEPPEHPAEDGRDRLLEVLAILLLALAAVGTAWSGYQAARWSGAEAHDFAEADALHARSTRALTRAGQDRLQDLSDFERWLDLTTRGDANLAAVQVLHFRPEFRPAFDAWIALDPLVNADAPRDPLKMPQYEPEGYVHAADLERDADTLFEDGTEARDHADSYVLTTVFFALVLFFAGISLRIRSVRLRAVILAIATAFLVYGTVELVVLPRYL